MFTVRASLLFVLGSAFASALMPENNSECYFAPQTDIYVKVCVGLERYEELVMLEEADVVVCKKAYSDPLRAAACIGDSEGYRTLKRETCSCGIEAAQELCGGGEALQIAEIMCTV